MTRNEISVTDVSLVSIYLLSTMTHNPQTLFLTLMPTSSLPLNLPLTLFLRSVSMRLRVRTNLRLLTPPSSLSLPLFSHPLRLSLSLSKPKAPPRSLRLRHQQHGFRSRRSLLLQALPHRLEGPPNSASGHRFLLL